MSRRLPNLLASLVVAGVVSLGTHLYLGRVEPPGGPGGTYDESPPTLDLRFAGIEPRKALRLDMQEGHEELVRFTLWSRTSTSSAAGGADIPAGLGQAELGGLDLRGVGAALGAAEDAEREATFTIEIAVTEASEDTITISWDVDHAQAMGDADETWTKAVKRARKLGGETTLSRRGETLAASVDGPSPRGPEAALIRTLLRRWMAEPAPLLPAEPVGHGAIWQVRRELTDDGVRTAQSTRVEVTDLRPGRFTLEERHSAELLSGAISGGEQMALLTPSAQNLVVTGEGSWTADLGFVVAPGTSGGQTSLDIAFTLGVSELITTSSTQLELVVDRP